MNTMSPQQLTSAYRNACMLELQALKPGNVHIFADGHRMTIHHFIKSADVSAEIISQANLTVGERIFAAVQATHQSVGLNTNLGIILLSAPLIQARLQADELQTFNKSLQQVLQDLTVNDATLAAQAIILANPAGLGSASQHDVHSPAQVSLLEMMRSAQHTDRIAWQYANAFLDILGFGVQRYDEAMSKWQNTAYATTALYLGFLTHQLDTHIIRKHGHRMAMTVMAEAQALEAEYSTIENPKRMQKKLMDWDAALKVRELNPGTSADLTVASLLAKSLIQSL
jgi:triphosphoribosyl-dephospho-CoA synthase